jgi:hypothetical protein
MKYKTRISFLNILSIYGGFFLITQTKCFINRDFFNKTAWIIYASIIIYFYILNLFFARSFEISATYLMVKFPILLFFKKSKIYYLNEISFIKIIHKTGRGSIPFLTIRLKNSNSLIKHYYFLISKRSIIEMVALLNKMNTDARIVNML